MKWWWIGLFVAIHLFYYASALRTDHLLWFFPWDAIQSEKTLDYSQIPHAVLEWRQGGNLCGPFTMPAEYPLLRGNVYHPVFTLLIGLPLQGMSISTGFAIFSLVKLLISSLLFVDLYRRAGQSPRFVLAAFVWWVFFVQGVEIGSGQYHFFLNTSLYLFLLGVVENRSDTWLTGWLLASLLVKPIALLWVPLLMLRGKIRVAVAATLGFAVLTGIGCLFQGGSQYLELLVSFAGLPTEAPAFHREMVFNLQAVVLHWGAGIAAAELLKYSAGIGLLALFFVPRISLFCGLLLATSYYLLFYSGAFEYHYTTLIPFLVLGLLTQRDLRHPFALVCILVACLPSPYFLFKQLDLFALPSELAEQLQGIDPQRVVTAPGLFLMLVVRVMPVMFLALFLVARALDKTGKDDPAEHPESSGCWLTV